MDFLSLLPALISAVSALVTLYVVLVKLPSEKRQMEASADISDEEAEAKRLTNYNQLWQEVMERDTLILQQNRQIRDLTVQVETLTHERDEERKRADQLELRVTALETQLSELRARLPKE